MVKLGNQPNVVLLLGFDCDRPRDAFIYSKEGSEMAERKLNSITQISNVLNELKLPRTFFVCGHFLKSMNYKYNSKKLKQSFIIIGSCLKKCNKSINIILGNIISGNLL